MNQRVIPAVALTLAAVLSSSSVAAPPTARAPAAVSKPVTISFAVNETVEESVEGPDVKRTYFTVGDQRVAFGVPPGCHLNTGGDGFVLTFTETGLDGEVRVSRSSFKPEFDLATNVAKYRDAAFDKVPKGATQVEEQKVEEEPFPYNGWKSLGFIWNYALYGRLVRQSVSYVNLESGAQAVVTTLAARSDADRAENAARQFLGSWYVMSSAK